MLSNTRKRRIGPQDVTLLELVTALGATMDSPDDVVSRARDLIDTGAVRLRGNFRDAPWAVLGKPAPAIGH